MFNKTLIFILLITSCSYQQSNQIDSRNLSNNEYINTIINHNLNDKTNTSCYGNNIVGFFSFKNSNQINDALKPLDHSQITNNIYRLAIQYKKLIQNLKAAYQLPEYLKIEKLLTKLLATFNYDIFEVNKFIHDDASHQNLLQSRLQLLEEIDNYLLRLPLFAPLNNFVISLDQINILEPKKQNFEFYLKSHDEKVLASGQGRVKLHTTSSNDLIIEIQHTKNMSSFYNNLQEILVNENDLVKPNQVIATAKENIHKEKVISYYIKNYDIFIKPSIFMFHHYNCK